MRLPLSWRDITVKQFYRINDILTDDTLDDTDKSILLLSFLAGVKYVDVLQWPLKKKARALRKTKFIFGFPTWNPRLNRIIKAKGKYYHVPKFKSITGGQYVDIMTFLKEPGAETNNIHLLLACYCLPARFGLFRQKYDGAKVPEIAEAFLDLPMSDAWPIMVFFCHISANLMTVTQDYLSKMTKTMDQRRDQIITKDLDGLSASTVLPVAMEQSGITSQI